MNKLEIAKRIIRENLDYADCGIFNSPNNAGNFMSTLYDKDDLIILISYDYSYFEVFGLKNNEFQELKNYYNDLRSEREE